MTNFTFKVRFLLILLIALLCFETQAISQETNADSSTSILQNSDSSYKRGEFRARISEEYLRKFTQMSDDLQVKEEDLASLQYRMEAVKERSKQVQAKEQKDLFKENIKSLKITESQLSTEIRLIKKALRLLQENKSNPDPDKMKVLTEIEDIEAEILKIKQSSETAKKDLSLDNIEVETRDVYLDPPQEACDIAYNGIDASSNKQRKEIARQFLFGYTHPKLKNFFKDNHFLECEVKLMELDKKKYLWLYITISSKDAIKNYGFIQQNSPMKFELLNGEILYAASAQNAMGRLEPYTGNTKYEVILPLDKSKYRQFSKGEIDKVGVMWTSGYEQYEVYNVDVVMNQIECLENL